MAAPGSLDRQPTGPIQPGQGVRKDLDPKSLPVGVASSSKNFEHIDRILSNRSVMYALSGFTSGMTASGRTKAWTGMLNGKLESGTPFIIAASASRFTLNVGAGWSNVSGSYAFGPSANTDPWNLCYGVDGSTAALNGGVFGANGVCELAHLSTTAGSFSSAFTALTSETASGYKGPASMIPRYCTVYNGRLVVGHITEGSTIHGTRTRCSAVNSFFTFDTTLGGIVTDHADSPGTITGINRLGDNLLVLKEDAILIGVDTGATINFPRAIDTGCQAGESFRAHVPYKALFLGPDNIYELTTGSAEPVGTAIAKDLLANLDRTKVRQIVSEVHPSEHQYRLWIALGGYPMATRCYVYDWTTLLWWIEDWPLGVSSTSVLAFGSGTAISALTGTIGSYSGLTIGSWASSAAAPKRLVGSLYNTGDYRVFELAAGTSDHAVFDAALNCSWESGDIRLNPSGYALLRSVTVTYSADSEISLGVAVSNDGGSTWSSGSVYYPSGENEEARFTFLSYGLYHRVRIDAGPVTVGNRIEIKAIEASFVVRGSRR